MLGASLVLVAVSFTAVTLLVGEPFYERIWKAVESDVGDSDIDSDYRLWRSVWDGLVLFARGVGVALLAALLGLIPVVGGVFGAVFAVLFTGWLLADELTSRALTARGMGPCRTAQAHATAPRPSGGFRCGHATLLHRAPRRGRNDAGRRGRSDAPRPVAARRHKRSAAHDA